MNPKLNLHQGLATHGKARGGPRRLAALSSCVGLCCWQSPGNPETTFDLVKVTNCLFC